MNPFFHTGFSISDSLKTVRKSVLIYETIIEDAIYCFLYGNIQGAFASVHKLKALIEYIKIPKADEMVHELTETLRAGKSEGVEVGLNYLKDVLSEVKSVILEEMEKDQTKEK